MRGWCVTHHYQVNKSKVKWMIWTFVVGTSGILVDHWSTISSLIYFFDIEIKVVMFTSMMHYVKKNDTNHALTHLGNFWKYDSWLKIRFSAQMSNNAKNTMKHSETPTKHVLEAFWEILENMVLCSKIRFSAQMSNNAKIPWNTQKTPLKHALILNNLLAMVRCLGQPSLFIILQMICTDQNWGCC